MKKRPTPSPVPAVKMIPIEKITVPSTRHRTERPFDELQRSIAAIGLLNPIVVTPERTLVAGLHRLRACAALGWKEIPVTVVPLSLIDAELAEIDENLCRTELTVLERGEHLARRKALYVARHPETRVGAKGGGRGGVGSRGTENENISFSVDAAGQLGESRRNIEMEVQIAEGLSPESRDALRNAPIANRKADLLALVRLDEAERQPILALLASGAATTVAEARRQLEEESLTEVAPVFDRLGHPVTVPGIAAFLTLIHARTGLVLHHLRAAKRAWGHFHEEMVAAKKVHVFGSFRGSGYGRLREALERDLAFMIYVVKNCAPYSLCPYCGGAPWSGVRADQCEGCGGVGWGDRALSANAPPELNAALDARGLRALGGEAESADDADEAANEASLAAELERQRRPPPDPALERTASAGDEASHV